MLDFKNEKDPKTNLTYLETSITGKTLLSLSQLNKGTAFTEQERHDFDLLGRIPARVETLEEQTTRAYEQYCSFNDPRQKNIYFNNIHNINQVLFYRLVSQHLSKMLPILYTPTVGSLVENFSKEYRRSRGLYISYRDIDHIDKILDNRSNPQIDIIVVTDGEGVLGIGDQGIGGIDIPIAKLMVYTLCAGIDPNRTLPIQLDVGTNNETLLNDPYYLGLREPRISGKAYDDFVDAFVQAIKRKFPKAFLHWEDFGRDNARRVLDKYLPNTCTFNDDIQGTGVVTLATILAAVQYKKEKLSDQQIVIYGAGSAGVGIADQIKEAMVREGTSEAEANKCFWLLDRKGLIHTDRTQFENVMPAQIPYAKTKEQLAAWQVDNRDQISLKEVIHNTKITVLIGCSAQARAFSEDIIRAMGNKVNHPIVLPLSNPTYKAEATPEQLMQWTEGRALIATGSPFAPVTINSTIKPIAQCNNALVFPGLGLGILAVDATRCTENLLYAACMALSVYSPIHHNPDEALLPDMSQAREVAKTIAIAVAKQAVTDGLAQIKVNLNEIEALVEAKMWEPTYLPYKIKSKPFFKRLFCK
jgi:malate dehydrogenase (oxaloacetate-decarboxylating)